ncbi:hypothetical protein P170DRAFT_431920 [Aspergillus steynii IBT 23096]|uniref:Thioesterase family protein n=1 Tax=Aspergillus steynii IBT 23096 TaxID=1392250 RepID=A0A2I2GN24_9EURO|nr:uncharacterized protein P170DRAFT_431920 [Aspergillus steynii IBT 23096]PLB54291.1 hypothetical protein P170DRAFT_431920 [Aspergillus steynii IBT 23096]
MPASPVNNINNNGNSDKPTWEEAIRVTPLGSHRYSAVLQNEWCIGTVPHGGYTTAVLYRLATTHFAHSHASRYNAPATPISIQLTFLRRTSAGPAVLSVQDMKLGARTSTIHVTLSQPRETKEGEDGNLEAKVTGYITVSPATAEVGLSANTGWHLSPAALPGSGANGRVNLTALGRTGRDGGWMRLAAPFPKFRRATQQVELYGPDPALGRRQVVDQWARFRPNGNDEARWTNEAAVFLTDMFPMALDGLDKMASAALKEQAPSAEQSASHWYPTVTLNIDLKKRLPPQGVEWLYSRVHTKTVRDGRTDIDVVLLDEQGEVVALSTQVGLVLSASRNVGQRSKM